MFRILIRNSSVVVSPGISRTITSYRGLGYRTITSVTDLLQKVILLSVSYPRQTPPHVRHHRVPTCYNSHHRMLASRRRRQTKYINQHFAEKKRVWEGKKCQMIQLEKLCNIFSKTAALDTPLASRSHTHPLHSETSRLLTSSLNF
jgi:hypothetical protein